jgi:hypothetical protein
LCDDGVARAMTHCLFGRDRTDYCESMDLDSVKAQWVFGRCLERGIDCHDKKRCPCANAYRAIDSFCRHDQKGVASL